MRPILLGALSVNHRAPSGPAAMETGPHGPDLEQSGYDAGSGIGNSVMAPEVVMRPILLAYCSVNHRAPSGPSTIPPGPERSPNVLHRWHGGIVNSVIEPDVVMCPILLPHSSVNHRLPSGPVTMPQGLGVPPPIGNSVIMPSGVTRAIAFGPLFSVNHTLPSGPVVICSGCANSPGMGNSVIMPSGVMRPIWLEEMVYSVNQRFPSGPAVIPCGLVPAVGVGNSLNVWPVADAAPRRTRRERGPKQSFKLPPNKPRGSPSRYGGVERPTGRLHAATFSTPSKPRQGRTVVRTWNGT